MNIIQMIKGELNSIYPCYRLELDSLFRNFNFYKFNENEVLKIETIVRIIDDWVYESIIEEQAYLYESYRIEKCLECSEFDKELNSCEQREDRVDELCEEIDEQSFDEAHESVNAFLYESGVVDLIFNSIVEYIKGGGLAKLEFITSFDWASPMHVADLLFSKLEIEKHSIEVNNMEVNNMEATFYFNLDVPTFNTVDIIVEGNNYIFKI